MQHHPYKTLAVCTTSDGGQPAKSADVKYYIAFVNQGQKFKYVGRNIFSVP